MSISHTDRWTDGQTYQKYSWKPLKKKLQIPIKVIEWRTGQLVLAVEVDHQIHVGHARQHLI